MNTTMQELTQETINQFVGAAHGDFDKVKELAERYPELVNTNAVWVETPIEAAAQMGRRDIIEYLLSKGAPLDICTAAVLGMKDKVEALLAEDPSRNKATGAHGFPLMYFPAAGGHKEIAELLLAHGADINAGEGSNTPLHAAALFGQPDMAEWLLKHRANPVALDYDGKTTIERAELIEQFSVVDAIKRHEAK